MFITKKMPCKGQYIAALDIGTTNIRCIIYGKTGRIKGHYKSSIELLIPSPGFVEIVPDVLWNALIDVVRRAVDVSGITFRDLYCIALSCQRNSFTLWNRNSGKTYHNFIAWNDIRGEKIVVKENKSLKMKIFRLISKGLYLVTRNPRYLLGSNYKLTNAQIVPRLLWLINHNPDIVRDLHKRTVAFGTIDSWLLYKLSGNTLHMTDVSSASATGLFDPFLLKWSPWPFKLFGIPKDILPDVVDSAGYHFGYVHWAVFGDSIPIVCSMADQSASLLGAGCLTPGDTKVTLGTGTFLNVNTGDKPLTSFNGIYPLVAWKMGETLAYMAEGASNDTGVVLQWAQRLGLLAEFKDSETMAFTAKENHGVYFVPAFSGLQAPINDATAAAGFIGLKLTTGRPDLVRALLEGIVYRLYHLFHSFYKETGFKPQVIRLDGGVANNDYISQMLSDLLYLNIERSDSEEISAIGAVFLAGRYSGFWKTTSDLYNLIGNLHTYIPRPQYHKYYYEEFDKWCKAAERFTKWY